MLHSIGTKHVPNASHPVRTLEEDFQGYALCGGGSVTHFTYWDKGSYLWDLEPVTEETEDPTKQRFTGRVKRSSQSGSCHK